ncbi:MAG: M3 family oligoendopeptidase [Spirochaetales bacterium]|nr:M3 family oligoendopeptidase [Spirochaetales bacterium]
MNNEILPDWNLEGIFAGFNSSKYKKMFSDFTENISKLEELIQQNFTTNTLIKIIKLLNQSAAMCEELFSYAYCKYSTNTSDPQSIQEINRIEEASVGFNTFLVKFRIFLSENEEQLSKTALRNEELSKYSFFFKEQIFLKDRQMPPELEELAADLALSGSSAWEKLHQTLSSSTVINWDEDGTQKTSVELRTMAFDADSEIRKKAWEKEIELWKSIEVPLAFSLNGIKGASNTVNAKRNYKSTLERSAHQGRLSTETLNTMINVMTEALPEFRRYLKLKASFLGEDKLPFYDLFAPVSSTNLKISFSDAESFIIKQFSNFSLELGTFAEKAFNNNWIDAAPKKGKVGGAYCTALPVCKESRILCNYGGSFSDLSTVAHELGHAYHNEVLNSLPQINRDIPMTLAETASIFCETIILEGALSECKEEEKLSLIEHELMESTQVIVDILSRFIFEKEVFRIRKDKELSPEDFCNIMKDAQLKTYGDAMDENFLHPYMWAVKGHYYSQELGFYNFPYAFGKLFGLGLYSIYKKEGDSFAKRYKEILSETGKASAEDVTKIAGYDITKKDFWQSSINIIVDKIDCFENLCKKGK